MQLRFPAFPSRGGTKPPPVELALSHALVGRFPQAFPELAALLATPGTELEEIKGSLRRCIAEQTTGQHASSVCGLSLTELRELLGELSRKRLSAEQKRRRADYLTRMRNRDFGF